MKYILIAAALFIFACRAEVQEDRCYDHTSELESLAKSVNDLHDNVCRLLERFRVLSNDACPNYPVDAED